MLDRSGFISWPDSDAKAMLEEDIESDKHKTMTKKALWSSRSEYYENFPFEMFVKHVHQELRSRKFTTYVVEQRAKKRKIWVWV